MENIDTIFGIAASAAAIIASIVAIAQSRSAKNQAEASAMIITKLEQQIAEIQNQAGRDLNQVRGDLNRLEQKVVVIQNRPMSGIFGDGMISSGNGGAGFAVIHRGPNEN
ncbi:hypothetical protein [Pseudomonas sp. VEM90]